MIACDVLPVAMFNLQKLSLWLNSSGETLAVKVKTSFCDKDKLWNFEFGKYGDGTTWKCWKR